MNQQGIRQPSVSIANYRAVLAMTWNSTIDEPPCPTRAHCPDEPKRSAGMGETLDLTSTDYAFTPREGGTIGSVVCWDGRKPHEGDYLILRNGSASTRYRVESMDPCLNVDPPTMWMANVSFAPRHASFAPRNT